jgi:hypothetical protein
MNSNSNSNSNDMESVPIYFKVAHTGENTMFHIPTNICMKNFVCLAKNEACRIFNIRENSIIEVVEAGQGNENLRSEDAQAVEGDCNITFQQKYNGTYNNLAFYIRVLQ